MNNLYHLGGFLVIDKPEGMTSHDVVRAVRRQLRVRKAGHLGTLDPMATGVLPIAVGKATRLVEFLKGGRKVYNGSIRLGFSTDTYDREGVPTSAAVAPAVTQEQLAFHAARMLGEHSQMPPPFSAKKLQGLRAYQLARQGKPVHLAACSIHIDDLSLTLSAAAHGEVEFTICCSAGTYVRSVAHELGQNLGCGAHLTRLRRLRSGEFPIEQAISLSDLRPETVADLSLRLIPLEGVLTEYPTLQVTREVEPSIAVGKVFSCARPMGRPAVGEAFWHRVLSSDGRLIALAKPVVPPADTGRTPSSSLLWHPVIVLIAKQGS